MKRRTVLAGLGATAGVLAMPSILKAQAPITLNGAVQFNDDHAFNRALLRFEELVQQYYGKPVNFTLHKNSSLGLEKQYFEYMSQGKAVDYGIVSPAHMSTFAKAAPFIDAPFVFKGIDHMNKVVEQNILAPIADEVAAKAEVVLVGYAGGGIRNIFANKPIRNLAEIKGLKVRVQGAPIWSKTFAAVGMSPTVIAYNEIYNAIQNGVIAAGENEAAGVEAMKFYEVAPHLNLTQHAVSIRPHLLLGENAEDAAKGIAGSDLQGGQGSRRLRPQTGVERRSDKARHAGEGGQAQARTVRGTRRHEEARRSRDGPIRQGNRRRGHLRQDQHRLRLICLGPVIAGLDPRKIPYLFRTESRADKMDTRVKPAHDDPCLPARSPDDRNTVVSQPVVMAPGNRRLTPNCWKYCWPPVSVSSSFRSRCR